MSLSNEDRQVLDLIDAWQRKHPAEFGPRVRDIEHDLETILGLADTGAILDALATMENRGLLERSYDTDLRLCLRTVGLLERLAHESAP